MMVATRHLDRLHETSGGNHRAEIVVKLCGRKEAPTSLVDPTNKPPSPTSSIDGGVAEAPIPSKV